MIQRAAGAASNATADAWLSFLAWAIPTLLVLAMVVALVLIGRYWRAFDLRASNLKSLIESIDPHDIVATREEVAARAEHSDRKILGPLWHEFDETLVVTDDGKRLFNTVEAVYFFNRESMAPEYADNRLLAATPGMLAAFGVFGTFLSLTIGLTTLDTGNADALASGVQTLMTAAGVAFLKSVVGVAGSLLVTVVEKIFERHIARQLTPLQNKIDTVYHRTTPEKSLVDIADHSRESKLALQELHEKIGAKLQESVQSMGADIQMALRGAIEESMTPSMARLVEITSQQSTRVFDDLVGRFASSFSEIGEKQAAMLDASSQRLNGAIDGVSTQFDALVRQSREHSEEIARRQAELVSGLESTLGALTKASTDLDAAATSLSGVGAHVAEASTSLGQGLTQTAATLFALYEKATVQAREMEQLRSESHQVEADLAAAATSLAGATVTFGGEIAALRETQSAFQSGVRTDAEAFRTALRDHVAALQEQVEGWLGQYATDVERQLKDRMSAWDTHSRDYADTMLQTARSLRELLDEIQTREVASVRVVYRFLGDRVA